MSTAAPSLPADLTEGLRRLKLATMRQQAPEVLQTAKTQRWSPEEVLRALVQAELAARSAANERQRRKAAGFPVDKHLASFDVGGSSIPPATFAYIASLEWVTARETLLLVGPPGTGKSHVLIGAGLQAIQQGLRVRYLVATDLVELLYRGLADNTVGQVISSLLRADLILLDEVGFAPLDETGSQLLFRFVAAAYERRSLGVASHWPFEQWGRFLPSETTAASLLDRLLHHSTVVITTGESWRLKEARQRGRATPPALSRPTREGRHG